MILGIGYPSIIPTKGQTAMRIADVDGISLAGITFDAGPIRSEVLVQVGDENSKSIHSENPTFLFDVFCRVGTDKAGTATSCVIINSNNVYYLPCVQEEHQSIYSCLQNPPRKTWF